MRAIRPTQVGSTQTVKRPAVVPTNPRARAARSPAAGQGRRCKSHGVLMAPRSKATAISAPSLSHVVGTKPMRHDTSRMPPNQSRVHARRQTPHRRVVARLRDPMSDPITQALTIHAGASACRLTGQACASYNIWRIETPRPAQNQHSVDMRLPINGSIVSSVMCLLIRYSPLYVVHMEILLVSA
jgi:hypothetical protein